MYRGRRLRRSHVQKAPDAVTKPSTDVDEEMSDASEDNALNLLFAETTIPVCGHEFVASQSANGRKLVSRSFHSAMLANYGN
ncbi:hypothetical protein F5879DRAFT_981055 [Lentinula edodes]|nr:hypothetical protein F5879DRAFT_981055 [Lentinula edodes]